MFKTRINGLRVSRMVKLLPHFVKLVTFSAFMCSAVIIAGGQSGGTTARQNAQQANTDQTLKSSARVNPSTLAMEFSLPIASYPGRAGNALPIGFSYSSKVWRMKSWNTWFYTVYPSPYPRFVTDVTPVFGERSAAGWTSSLLAPRLEEEFELFDQYGKPFNNPLDVTELNSRYADLENLFSGDEPIRTNQRPQGPEVTCGWGCAVYRCDEIIGDPNGNYRCTCSLWIWREASCPVEVPAPAPPPSPEPPDTDPPRQMHYVKRIKAYMPDGSSQEFRKDDGFHSYCDANGNPNNGPNCDGVGRDKLGTYLSVDGSGTKLVRTSTSNKLLMPDGSYYLFGTDAGNGFWNAHTYVDKSGNRSTFDSVAESWTDTMGRVLHDPLPANWTTQSQAAGKQALSVPSVANSSRDYELSWLNLKGSSAQESALENYSEELRYETPKLCRGNISDPLPPSNSSNEILFPAGEAGMRVCATYANSGGAVAAGLFNPVVLAGVELPNGQKYEFKYNVYGEITKIVFPTGAYERFRYDAIVPLAGANSSAFDQTNRGVVERWMYDSSNTLQQRWTYEAEYGTGGYKVTSIGSKANDPMVEGAKTERILFPAPSDSPASQTGNFGYTDPLAGMPAIELGYDENGALRSRTLNDWVVEDPRTGGDSRAVRDPRNKRTISVSIENGQALALLKESEYETPGQNGSTAPTDPEYFAHLNVKRTKAHHFRNIPLSLAQTGTFSQIAAYFNSSTVATIGETDYAYDANYMARGISSLPIETRVLDPADNSVLAKTQTKYDNQLPNISTGYPGGYSALTYSSISSSYDCGMTAPKVCWADPATSYLGRPTTSRLWNKDATSWIETHTRYDIFGNAVQVRDPVGKEVSTEYEDTYEFAYPTRVNTPAPDPTGIHGTNEGSFSETSYDLSTGLPIESKNEFNQITKTEYNDPLLRPTRTFAVNFSAPESQTVYDDNALTVKVRKQLDSANWDEATTYADSLGRTIKTVAKDSQGDVIVETKYDLLGRVTQVSNPYRQGETVLWSKSTYDAVGRVVETFAPAIAGQTGDSLGTTSYEISTVPNYFGAAITSTDAAGNSSRSITNALGQLIMVEEPNHAGTLLPLPQATPNPSPTPNPNPTPGGGGDPSCPLRQNCPPLPLNANDGEYPSYPTFYTYDPTGKMVMVEQGVQKRFFKYDSLGRMIRVSQPEQERNQSLDLSDPYNTSGHWTAGFTYDVLGNVLTATDANGVTITNTYDNTGRVKTRSYSGEPQGQTTPEVSFFYDGKGLDSTQSPNYAKGKLTKVTSSVSETRYKLFDYMGRMTQMEQRTPFDTEPVANATPRVSKYTYNFSGALIEEEYPSGRKVKNEFEPDGDLMRVSSQKAGANAYTPFASNFSYTASGGISHMRLGNGRWETAKFNERMQVTELGLGTSGSNASIWKVNYEYGELNGNSVDATKNIGNIARQTLTVPGTSFVQSYTYDSLCRLTQAKEVGTAQNWIQNWQYDRYGNRTGFSQDIMGLTDSPNPAISSATNRFTDQTFAYDKNGNVIGDIDPNSSLPRTFKFNGDNKQTEVKRDGIPVGRYFYDGEGKRVKKVTDQETTIFVYSGGKLVAEYSTITSSNPTTAFTTTDHLGSPRIITNALGAVTSRRDFLPFGEDIYASVGARTSQLNYGSNDDEVRQKFTGYQKDNETGLDFAEARMYENRFGRFTAVDPLLASGKSANPQTFNRYVYVSNDPVIKIDPTGLMEWVVDRTAPVNIRRPTWVTSEEFAKGGYEEWKDTTYTTDSGQIVLDRQGPFKVSDYDVYHGYSVNGVKQGTGLFNGDIEAGLKMGPRNALRALVNLEFLNIFGPPRGASPELDKYKLPLLLDYETPANLTQEVTSTLSATATNIGIGAFTGTAGSRLPIGRNARGVPLQGISFETKFFNKHIANSSKVMNILGKGDDVHVFNSVQTFMAAEEAVLTKGTYTGFERGYYRYNFRFEKPIGMRIQHGKPDVALYGAQIKIRPEGLYHVIPTK